jgi:hypothetical protein
MPDEFRECAECKALFAAEGESEVCERCSKRFAEDAAAVIDAITRYNMHQVAEIAAFVGMPTERVERLVQESPAVRDLIAEVRRCERCRKEPAAARSPFCIPCQVELNSALGQAASELTERVREEKTSKQGKGQPTGLHSEANSKRIKADHGRLTPKGRYSS